MNAIETDETVRGDCYDRGYAAALEDAGQACRELQVTTDLSVAVNSVYNAACGHCADAIAALKETP